MYCANCRTNPAIGVSDDGASDPRNRSSTSSFSRTLGGTLFMALISSGPATNGAHWFCSPGGYQRLFAFTGSLGHHLERPLAAQRDSERSTPMQVRPHEN